MKRRLINSITLAISVLCYISTYAHTPITTDLPCEVIENSEMVSIPDDAKDFKIKICFGIGPLSVCTELICDLHWTDIIQPGFGQLLGHNGCVLPGSLNVPGQTTSQFANSEEMVQQLENAMSVPKGTLEQFTITLSPTFPLPDGNNYRVVAKTYPVLQGSAGRFVPLEFEKAR